MIDNKLAKIMRNNISKMNLVDLMKLSEMVQNEIEKRAYK